MSLTNAQQTAVNNLDAAISACEAISDSGDGNYHRTLVARSCGVLAAVEVLEPNWTGYPPAIADTLAWSSAHPPR